MVPDLDWNRTVWSDHYDWTTGGEEWSQTWGGSEAQWFGSLYPRLHRFLPSQSILEIGPGFGRWTTFLLMYCSRYFGIDLSELCVNACRRRFCETEHAHFVQNDGLSLSGINDNSCDLVFSFDSLVHVELDVLAFYVPEILRVLSPAGVAFIHHSNLLPFAASIGCPHDRSRSVSAENFSAIISNNGGRVLIQEVVNWGGPYLHDCLTLFAPASTGSPQNPILLNNDRFMDEALIIRDFQSHYSKCK